MNFRTNINYHDERFLMFVLDMMANEKELNGEKVIRMTLGKSELPLHDNIVETMQKTLENFKNSTKVFPGGLPELKEKLAQYYGNKYDTNLKPENFIISVGTSAIFRNLFRLYLKEGDEVLLPMPYYSLYHFCALLMGAKVKFYNIDLETLSIDMESFRANYTDKTRIVVINNPGNPLGNIIIEEELYEMDSIIDGNSVVISDEIYDNMCFDEQSVSVMQLKNTKSKFITTNAFSKGYRMYSKRVGYCIVPDELITPLTVIQHHTLLTLDPTVQYGAIAALEHENEVDNLRKIYKGRRDYTVNSFKSVKDVISYPAKGSFYITLNCEEYMRKNNIETSLDLAKSIFESTNVATVPGSDFGLPNALRLSYSSNDYNEGIDRLVDYFSC